MKVRTALIVLAALGLAGAAVYVRRKRAAAGPPSVQLGLADGSLQTLTDKDAGAAELQQAAGALRQAFEAGA